MIRVGIGYDIHRFTTEKELRLGGILFPGQPGLKGHSDADVVLHAIADALLGAIALGDIGDHFPPGDPKWKDVNSGVLIGMVLDMLPDQMEIGNVDVTIVGERPKIAPHRQDMRVSISNLLQIDVDRVSVKATTHEGLGTLGRGEGLAAIAVIALGMRE